MSTGSWWTPLHERAWRESLQSLMDSPAWATVRQASTWSPEGFTSLVYETELSGKPREAGALAALEYFHVPDAQGHVQAYADAKQARLEQLIQAGDFRAYDDAVRFVFNVHNRGLRTVSASSSKNARAFLERVNLQSILGQAEVEAHDLNQTSTLLDILDTDVSGRDFPHGKPAPDIFLGAAAQLGEPPAVCFVVEERCPDPGGSGGRHGGARHGPQGRRGHARAGRRDAGGNQPRRRRPRRADPGDAGQEGKHRGGPLSGAGPARERPDALEHLGRFVDRPLALFLDYDGTLTPIVEDCVGRLRLSPGMRAALDRLERWPVAIVTGRDLATLQSLTGPSTLTVAASHGFQIWSREAVHSPAPAVDHDLLATVAAQARVATAGLPGVEVEVKPYSVAVHERRASSRQRTKFASWCTTWWPSRGGSCG